MKFRYEVYLNLTVLLNIQADDAAFVALFDLVHNCSYPGLHICPHMSSDITTLMVAHVWYHMYWIPCDC